MSVTGNDLAKEVNDLAKDVAMIVSKQLEVGDGPCKFYLVFEGDDIRYLRAFYDKGRMFFSVGTCEQEWNFPMVLNEPDIAYEWFMNGRTRRYASRSDLNPELERLLNSSVTWLVNSETKKRIPYKSSHNIRLYVNICKNEHVVNPVANFDKKLQFDEKRRTGSDSESDDSLRLEID